VTYAAADLDVAPGNAIAAAIADRFAAADAVRKLELERLVRCRYCRAWLGDASFKLSPGVCRAKVCLRRLAREPQGGGDARPAL
jgi:hypothetical protein